MKPLFEKFREAAPVRIEGSWRLMRAVVALNFIFGAVGAAGGEPVKGINVALFKNDSQIDLTVPGVAEKWQKENEKRLEVVASAGFNLVRLRFHLAQIRSSADPQQRSATVHLMADFATAANQRGIRVIVALFAENGRDQKDLMCDNPNELLHATDVVLAALPDSPLNGIEPLNEPFPGCGPKDGPQRWTSVQQVVYRHVRSERPNLIFVVSGDNWGGDLVKLNPSPYRSDKNVLFSLHFYDPMLFTHQGANWRFLPAFNRYVQGLPWPYDKDAVDRVESDVARQIDQDSSLDSGKRDALKQDLHTRMADYVKSGTESYLAQSLDQLGNWATSNGIAKERIFLGEFGVLRPGQNTRGRIMPDGDQWLKAVVALSRERNFQWAVWDLDTSFAIAFGGQGGTDKICQEFEAALK